jgi:Flp pilus assembly protein TadG
MGKITMLIKMKKILRKSERGQAIILIAFAVVGLVAMVGLMTDTGILLIEYGRLKRGIDAASIAAAQQFRKNYDPDDLENAARQFLTLNQADVFDVQIYTCTTATAACTADPTNADACNAVAEVCTDPVRKLVKVIATRHVRFGFLRVIGISETDITASSIGEAASIDLVMVIDTSASMAYATSGDPNISEAGDDPAACNLAGNCEPLESVKAVALQFLDTMFIPYDRVAIIASTGQYGFTGTSADQLRDPTVVLHFTPLVPPQTEADVIAAVEGLKVFQPVTCTADGTGIGGPAFGTCLNYDAGGVYTGQGCPLFFYGADMMLDGNFDFYDPSSCPSSNLGGALVRAAAEYSLPPVREDAFWATIMLAGGAANATDADLPSFPYGYCPSTAWTPPYCIDPVSSTRHTDGDADYDADDYARDAADFLADPVDGQGVTIFTIGLGNLVQNATVGEADMGEELLSYMAEEAGDSPGVTANHGTYDYAPDATDLAAIFQAIADNIFTRLSQ